MNNKVIYTCLVGGYDNLQQPEVIYSDFDYICFVGQDVSDTSLGIWTVKTISVDVSDKTRLSRYPKINPHLFLSDYEYSIYIDANIIIKTDFLKIKTLELIRLHSVWAQIRHTFVSNIYDDIIKSYMMNKEDLSTLRKQYRFLKEENYPQDFVLYENGLLFRKHNDPIVIEISEAWWNQYMKISKRDQQSLCFIFWKKNFKPDLLLPEGKDVRTHEAFTLNPHKQTSTEKLTFKYKNYRNRLIVFLFGNFLFK